MASHFSFTAPEISDEEAERERSAMSDDERQRALDDVYGRNPTRDEEYEGNVERITELLSEMQRYIDEIPEKEKKDLLQAMELCPQHVADYGIHFLRADFYDPVKAARRTAKYWEAKVDLFGADKAFHKTRLTDLSEADLATARNNAFYALPIHDEGGRQLIYSEKPRWLYKDRKEFLRWVWYTVESSMETYHRGVVMIGRGDGLISLKIFDRKLDVKAFYIARECFPVRICAMHVFYDSSIIDIFLPIFRFVIGERIRARLNIYTGIEREERLEKLDAVGISQESLPVAIGGCLEFNLQEWIEARRVNDM